MPSFIHEGLVELFRTSPDLAVDIVAAARRLPAFERIDVRPGDVVELVPASLRADVLLLLVAGVPVFVIVVEVQLGRDPDKRFSWPLYVAASRARYRCPACLLVFTVDDGVAAWCAEPIDLGQPDSAFRPLVRGPTAVPKVMGTVEAKAHPFRAVLSAIAYGHDADAETIGRSALEGVADMPEDERTIWQTAILRSLNEAARYALEAWMDLKNFPPEETWTYQKGMARGEIKGQLEGKIQGKAEALLLLLAARGLAVSDDARQRILACSDASQLDAWVQRAVTATSVEDLLASPS